MLARGRNTLKCLNTDLPEGWEAKLVPDEGRIFYVDHKTQSSSWLPPRENWDPGNTGLPYGWESALDKNKKPYFINHIENYTTRDDPRDDPDYVEPPKPRDVELVRDAQKGFGFVAGSEKPVVVRFVTEGGPSIDKLLPGDQLIKINGQDVKKAPREYVIDLVRSCKQSISLTVCQPYIDNQSKHPPQTYGQWLKDRRKKDGWLDMLREVLDGLSDDDDDDDGDSIDEESSRKSALLTAAKKDKLKKNPSRVRFAEEIIVNGASVQANSPEESYIPFMPNVLKVFLENGQTKSFKYDSKTTVKDVMNSLQEKLNIKCVEHFNLVLHNMKSHMPGRMTLLQEHETVAEIASRPGSRHFRCLFRLVYVPKDSYDLLKQDPIAFEYFYMQCVNDVIQERFANELKPDTILRLAALHIQQHAMSNNLTGKINIKTIEKEFGLEKFVPPSVRDNMRVKDLRKVLAHSLKMNQNLTAPGQKQLTALQAKLHYMKIVSELKTFGSRVFMVTLLDKKTEAMVLVGPKAGVSLVTNIRFYTLSMLADFSEIQCIKVSKEKDNMNRVELSVKGDEPGTLNLGLLKDDAINFVSMVDGYFRIFVDTNRSLVQRNASRQSDDPEVPAFESKHTVLTAPWSYPDDIVSMVIGEDRQGNSSPENERVIDLTHGPPAYEGDQDFISKLKHDLGIKSEKEAVTNVVNGNKEKVTPAEEKQVTDAVISPPKDKLSTPLKTVITIESGGSSPRSVGRGDDRVTRVDNQDSDSITSGSSTSMSQASDQEAELAPMIDPRRKLRSPVLDSRKQQQTPSSETRETEYINVIKKLENGENNSDTDSGVGAEADKHVFLIQDSTIPERGSGQGVEPGNNKGVVPSNRQVDTGITSDLPLQTELQIDLSSLMNPGYDGVSLEQESLGSTFSPDPESASFISPFSSEQLPREVAAASYDPRMFYNKEIYIDPDIIDLTLIAPFPPTQEELADLNNAVPQLPPSPMVSSHHPHHTAQGSTHHRHYPLGKTMSVSEDKTPSPDTDQDMAKTFLHRSASVGYSPDFLDEDIDAFIDKLTIQPPPSESSVRGEMDDGANVDPDLLGHSWNGPMGELENDGLEFDNPSMSKTIDLGQMALDEQLSSLVIPPPPQQSVSIDEIPIVPPIESVKERRKKFEQFTSENTRANMKKFFAEKSDSKSELKVDKKSSESPIKSANSDSGNTSSVVTHETKDSDKSTSAAKAKTNGDSPSVVSEKLNDLLKSLSTFEDEPTGHFRRTSSLRLGRCSSLDFLNVPQSSEKSQNASNGGYQLVTGSVRVRPKVRPSLSLERPNEATNGTINIPLKSASNDRLNNGVANTQGPDMQFRPQMQRTHSYDAIPQSKSDSTTNSDSGEVSETFASLKAKLQSYRDSLLNRSLRRKKSKDQEGDRASLDGATEEKQGSSTLTRSSSFSSLLRRSLRRLSEKDKAKQGRSASATRETTKESESKDGDKDLGGMSARDRKIWNTLTTPRSNFRPNTGSAGQTQDDHLSHVDRTPELERLAPKPPLPVSPSCEKRGEVRKQKSGPIKALSNVFGMEKSDSSPNKSGTSQKSPSKQTTTEKSPKRMAPEVPKSLPPSLSSSPSKSSSLSASPSTSSSAPAIPSAPPRRRRNPGLPASSEMQKLPLSEQKSKDDSDLNKSASSKSHVKTNPYATVGKMWRPMSMTSSASKNSESGDGYTTFNNFNALRNMKDGKPQTPASPKSTNVVENSKTVPNGHIGGSGNGISKATGSVSSSAVKSSPSKVESTDPLFGSVSEKSFAVLREKASASHSNSVKQILETVYTSEDFVQATNDVDRLLAELKQTLESLKSSRIDRKPAQFNMCKDELQARVRQFVTDAKLLVSNATQTKEKLAVNMDTSMHSLAKIFLHGQATMFMMEAVHQAQHLGSEVMRVANAYKSTLNAAHAAVGKPLSDPHMKYLMRQATNLATLLSTLLKSLKTLEQR